MGAISLGSNNQPILFPSGTIQLPNRNVSDPIVLIDAPTVPISQNSSIFVPSSSGYVHSQTVPSSSWEVYHNLGKHPSIHIEDLSGNVIITEIIHLDNNHARILFGGNYTGNAYCS